MTRPAGNWRARAPAAELDGLIVAAMVDAHDQDEQLGRLRQPIGLSER
jgi:hypothetical protein